MTPCSKAGSLDDNLIEALPSKEVKKGRQEDGTFVTSTGKVLAARKERRIPYDEPEAKQVEGNEEIVETPDGSVSFLAVRISDARFRRGGARERKRCQLRYQVIEVYTSKVKPQ